MKPRPWKTFTNHGGKPVACWQKRQPIPQWGHLYESALRKGVDHGYAAWVADQKLRAAIAKARGGRP